MKKLKKISIILMILISFLIAPKVFAKSNNDEIRKVEYSEDFKRWLKLSDEEKNKTIQPRMYDVIVTDFNTRNVFYKVRLLGAKSNSKYNLKNIIPENLLTKDQQQTNSCWTFAALTSLETNLALSDYRQGTKSKTYEFSERHMEYATSKIFKNNDIYTCEGALILISPQTVKENVAADELAMPDSKISDGEKKESN